MARVGPVRTPSRRRAHTKPGRRLGLEPRGVSLPVFVALGLSHPTTEQSADLGHHAADVLILPVRKPAPAMSEPQNGQHSDAYRALDPT